MIRAWLITITAVAVLVAGCSWSRSRPRQSLPYYCTPGPVEVGSPPPVKQECDRVAWEKDQERLKLEKEALDLYENLSLKYHYEMVKGGSETLPPRLEEYLAEPARGSFERLLATYKEDGMTARGENPKLTMRVIPNPHKDGSEVALLTCTDLRKSALYYPDGTKFSDGRINVNTELFKRYPDGKLRLFRGGGEEKDSCPF